MSRADPTLLGAAQGFADEIAELLDRTVAPDPPIRAEVASGRVVVGGLGEDGQSRDIPLQIAGEYRLGLRVAYRCSFDFTGAFLAIEQSEFALIVPNVRHPVVRFDYVRERAWASAHVQLHAESSAIGFLRAHAGKAAETWRLHLPVGGQRFRPSLEDVIEFAVREFGVECDDQWQERIEEGRRRWRDLQVKAAIRDVIKADPDSAPQERRDTIDAALDAVQSP